MIPFFNSFPRISLSRTKHIRGFTLVELLVSLALFTSIITIAVGALFSAQAVNVKLEQTQVVLDGVNLAVEVMTRDMRYGSIFYCDTAMPSSLLISRRDCSYGGSSGGNVLIFKPVIKLIGSADYSLDRIAYYLNNGIIYKDEYVEGMVSNKKTYQITASDVSIDTLTFFVTGSNTLQASTPDFNQPLITVVISGTATSTKQTIPGEKFNLQTTVSSRRLDN